MAQPRPRVRDFFAGRDQSMRRYAAPFSTLGSRDKADLERHCASLNREYRQQCNLYKSKIKNEVGMNISRSTIPFTNALVHFTKTVQRLMTLSQAKTTLASARLLRLFVAGRAVYTEKCVEKRDVGHVVAENLFGRALVALNTKRAAAIAVSCKMPKQKKKRPGKKGKILKVCPTSTRCFSIHLT